MLMLSRAISALRMAQLQQAPTVEELPNSLKEMPRSKSLKERLQELSSDSTWAIRKQKRHEKSMVSSSKPLNM